MTDSERWLLEESREVKALARRVDQVLAAELIGCPVIPPHDTDEIDKIIVELMAEQAKAVVYDSHLGLRVLLDGETLDDFVDEQAEPVVIPDTGRHRAVRRAA